MEREKLKVASQPHVHDLKFEEGEPLTLRAARRGAPGDRARAHAGLPRHAHRRPRSPTTACASRSSSCATRRRTWTPVEDKPRAGRHGDACSSRRPKTTGEIPGGAASTRSCSASGQAIPGIEELIMELTPGETTERPVKWPDDFPDEAQRGKTKTVRVDAAGREAESRCPRSTTRSRARSATSIRSTRCTTAVRKDLEEHA